MSEVLDPQSTSEIRQSQDGAAERRRSVASPGPRPVPAPNGRALMLCGHGSRDKGAMEEFGGLAEKLKARLPDWPIEHGYLEFAKPVIREGLTKLKDSGASTVLALPGMLFAAGHAKNDIPSVLNTYAAANGLRIEYGRELGIDLKMIRAAGARIKECLIANGWREGDSLHDTMLVVVGRGASDPDANSNVSKVMRMLWEGLGFGWGETVYSGVTFPLVEPGLTHAARLGYKRIVVFPYFLFTGVLVRRIYDQTDLVAAAHSDISFLKASYLGAHDLVVETFVDRLVEIVEGTNNMNCQMCKYREQVLGFEAEVGLAQESHHHHVEGVGSSADCVLCDDVCTGACRMVPGEGPVPGAKADGPGHAHEHHHHHGDGHSHGEEPSSTQVQGHSHADGHDHLHGAHDHGHGHSPSEHGHDHGKHDHHHHPYPHADHPLGPRSMRKV